MKSALKERAEDLSGVCVKEFLKEKRRKEAWDKVSLIQDQLHRIKPNVNFRQLLTNTIEVFYVQGKLEGKHFIYSPLHGWVTDKLGKEGITAMDLVSSDSDSDDEGGTFIIKEKADDPGKSWK